MASIGQRIRQARLEKGLTQQQLADPDLSKSLISLIENDRIRPSLKTLGKLAERLGRPVSEFLEPDLATPKDLQVLMALGEGSLSRRDYRKAEEWLEAARTLAEYRREASIQVKAIVCLAEAKIGRDDVDGAETLLAEAEGLPIRDERLRARILLNRANIALLRAKHREGIEFIHQAIALLDGLPAPEPELKIRALLLRGTLYGQLGRMEDALISYHQALEEAEARRNYTSLGDAYKGLAMVHRLEGSLDMALEYALRAKECFERVEDLTHLMIASRNLGILLLEKGEPASAKPYLEHSLRLAEDLQQDWSRGLTLTELARCALADGDLRGARRYAEDALSTVVALNDPAERGRVLLVLAGVERAEGNLDAALRYAREALAIFQRSDLLPERTEAQGLLGELLLAQGNTQEAAPLLLQAYKGSLSLTATRRLAKKLLEDSLA
ncbi:MAG: tetratricopeptide repeat protein [Armatimonadota bacterium]|nr:tetratricopeptide repeat protein [Armatimonadota bacterium]MDR5702207.1 tetratricopeptide repeat protein [Armatimonadota bacterium]